MHPSSLRAFQRHQEHDLKHPGLVDLVTPKQTTFLHRYHPENILNIFLIIQVNNIDYKLLKMLMSIYPGAPELWY
jgi:hypothetical protein